jgi:hypothetical protein
MTPRQIQRLKQLGPIVGFIFGAGVIYATLKDDVRQSVRTSRFEAESIRTKHRFERIEENGRTLDAICKALPRCNPVPQ